MELTAFLCPKGIKTAEYCPNQGDKYEKNELGSGRKNDEEGRKN